jgi:deferrochelatase/peroxidase EfeB
MPASKEATEHDGATEHFGFRDGISQPAVRGRLSELDRHFLARRYIHPEEPLALTHARPGQPLVWPGQFVFGYPGQDRTDPLAPLDPPLTPGPGWMQDGSFLVFRRLRQDVAAFRAEVEELRRQVRAQTGVTVSTEQMRALLVGRGPHGMALTRNPDADDPAAMDHACRSITSRSVSAAGLSRWPTTAGSSRRGLRPKPGRPERFSTVDGAPADDPPTRCPAFAHIRKANPRDLTTDQGDAADTLTRLVLRRGITYGTPYPEDPVRRPPTRATGGSCSWPTARRSSSSSRHSTRAGCIGQARPKADPAKICLSGTRTVRTAATRR